MEGNNSTPNSNNPPATFSSLIVDTLVDENDGNLSAGDLSLREALSSIDPGGTITFSPNLATQNAGFGLGTIGLTLGRLTIDKAVNINGLGADLLKISSNNTFDVLSVNDFSPNQINVTIDGLAIIDSAGTGIDNSESLTLSNSLIENNTQGGIANFNGNLNVFNSVIAGNTGPASSGGFISGSLGGGGIANIEGFTQVVGSTLIGNTTTIGDGGGILNFAGTLEVSDSNITGNITTGTGGGIYNRGLATVTRTTLSNNDASAGGGVYVRGELTVSDSTIHSNSATSNGGGIDALAYSNISLTNSTISGNVANQTGGGIGYLYGGTLAITNTTITNNTAGQGTGGAIFRPSPYYSGSLIKNSIIAGNIGTNPDVEGTLTSGGYNLIGNGNGGAFTASIGDRVGTSANPIDPLLTPLQDNGGPNLTHALLAGSPAIDAANPNDFPAFDQRGIARPQGNAPDIGAVESAFSAGPPSPGTFSNLTVDSLSDEFDSDLSSGDVSLREAIVYLQSGGTIDFASNLSGGSIVLELGELLVDKDLTITGLGANNLTVSGNNLSRVFNIDDGDDNTSIDANISGLTIADGFVPDTNSPPDRGGGILSRENLTLSDSIVRDNTSGEEGGGGLFNNRGNLTVANSVITNNNGFILGGGIGSYLGSLTVSNSTIASNTASFGAGIDNIGGRVTIDSSSIENNQTDNGVGGGIRNTSNFGYYSKADLTVTNSTISGNTATIGGGIWNYSYGSERTSASITDSTIEDNSSTSGPGGGIYNYRADLSLTNTTISNNTAATDGGGISRNDGNLTLINSTVTQNTALGNYGGGINSDGNRDYEQINVIESTISNNSSANFGGGIGHTGSGRFELTRSTVSGNAAGESGGGIFDSGNERFIVSNSTISSNEAGESGGGIFSNGPSILSSTIAENTADLDGDGSGDGGGLALSNYFASAGITNTIIAGNFDTPGNSGLGSIEPDVSGSSLSGLSLYNLIGDGTGSTFNSIFNQVGTSTNPIDPQLTPLQDNGGPTLTHALLSGSPAISAGDPNFGDFNFAITSPFPSPEFDQRGAGFPRVVGDRLDLGAVESSSTAPSPNLPLVVDTLEDDDDFDFSPGDLSLREALILVGTGGTITFDPNLATQDIGFGLGTIGLTSGINQLNISKSVTIEGLGANQLTISGNGNSRVFKVDDGNDSTSIDVTIQGLNITNGSADQDGGGVFNQENLTITDSNISGNTITGDNLPPTSSVRIPLRGAGIYSNGTLTLNNTTVNGNTIESSAEYTPGRGGGIYSTGDLNLNNSTVAGNSINGGFSRGGGIHTLGTLTAIDSAVNNNNNSGNRGEGGGIYNRGGNVELQNSDISGNQTYREGAGIHHHSGTFEIENSTVSNNSQGFTQGGGIFNGGEFIVTSSTISGNRGSGIFNGYDAGDLTVSNSVITNNSNYFGGGISIDSGSRATVRNSTISGNLGAFGGGIHIDGSMNSVGSGTLTLIDSTIDNNRAFNSYDGLGGGISNWGTIDVISSTVSNNQAGEEGGGIHNRGIFNLTNSSVSGNTVSGNTVAGGGIFNSADLTVTNSTITANTVDSTGNNSFGGGGIFMDSGVVQIANTIVAGNFDTANSSVGTDVLGDFTSNGYNLIGDGAGSTGFTNTGDLVGTTTTPIDPLLTPLQDNGGSTFTHALLSGSPAINAGDPNFAPPPEFDQRGTGFPRIVNSRLDIGAFESSSTPPPPPPPNNPPLAVDDSFSLDEDTSLTGDVLLNDNDPDGDPLSVSLLNDVLNGSLTLNIDGSFTYTPEPNFNGSDSFVYEVIDNQGGSATATVNLSINPVNDAPVAVDDSASTAENTAVTLDVLSNDTDIDGDTLSVSSVGTPTNGTVALNPDGTVTYTPNAGFSGTDNFTYEVSDGNLTDTATVALAVNPVNDAPVAADDSFNGDEDTNLNGNVLANDSDPDNDPLTASLLSDVSNGSLTFNPDGSFTYTPNANFNGSDSFTYEVSDGSLTDTATVALAVNPVNDAPVASNDSFTTDENVAFSNNVLSNDSDPDGDSLTATLLSNPSQGNLTFNGNGSFTYTPNANYSGGDSFTYEVNDDNGGNDTATVNITVNPTIGIDKISGTPGDDFLRGSRDGDFIEAGAGEDILIGSRGGDTLVGGQDSDIFLYTNQEDSQPNNYDVISDFQANAEQVDPVTGDLTVIDDTINLFKADRKLQYVGERDAFTPGDGIREIRSEKVGFDTWIYIDRWDNGVADMAIKLQNFQGTLTAEHFDVQNNLF
ncbi:MAG: tandem-95 repeat protein [Cyanobacteria bacterium SID2]|nr:tandem-95 repeat protein [Cyanobacteria bacterium SID2]